MPELMLVIPNERDRQTDRKKETESEALSVTHMGFTSILSIDSLMIVCDQHVIDTKPQEHLICSAIYDICFIFTYDIKSRVDKMPM